MSILRPALAQKFIEKTAKDFEYNINIMNDKGIIIASKDASRVGTFHEVAYGMLNGTIDTGVVKENQKYLGTKPGVNMFIDYKDNHVGVICVTGNPDMVRSFAGLVKTSMETMLEYELQMENNRLRRDKTDQLLYYLLFEEDVDIHHVNAWADECEINKDLIRVPIIIKYSSRCDHNTILRGLTQTEGYTHQDLITMVRNNHIIVFKAVNLNLPEAIKEYREKVEEYLNNLFKNLPKEYNQNNMDFFVGTLQNDLAKYRVAYMYTQDMALRAKGKNGIHFFNDDILNYFRSLVTIKTYDDIFGIYDVLFSDEDKKMICETVEALSNNNYHVGNSATALYIHRNTLLYRLNKIKESLEINPIANAGDREFLNELAHYFSNK